MRFFILITLFFHFSYAFDGQEKIDPILLQKILTMPGEDSPVFNEATKSFPILVFLDEQANLNEVSLIKDKKKKHQRIYELLVKTAEKSQKSLREKLEDSGLDYRAYYITNMIAIYEADRQVVIDLAKEEKIRRISANPKIALDEPMASTLQFNIPRETKEVVDNLTYIKADQVWEKLKVQGGSIVVAGQDTGIQWDHPAIKNQYRGYSESGVDHDYNWHDAIHRGNDAGDCSLSSPNPCDDNGHGTHTIASVVGDDQNGKIVGVAPKAKWIGCRNMEEGMGTPARYIECFEFFFAPYPYGGNAFKDGDVSKAPHVMNNSWGCPPSEGCVGDEFIPILKVLMDAGMAVVTSAGNSGPGCGTINNAPAHNTPWSFSIGAYDHRFDSIAFFSSRGPSDFDGFMGPNVTAPGALIESAIPGGGYTKMSGTSMAAPHVVGLVALMWSAEPKMIGEVSKTFEMIQATAIPKEAKQVCGNEVISAIPNNTYGYGVIDAWTAVNAAILQQ